MGSPTRLGCAEKISLEDLLSHRFHEAAAGNRIGLELHRFDTEESNLRSAGYTSKRRPK